MKKTVSAFLALTLLLGALCVSAFAAEDFEPVLRFVVASDAHIADSGSDQEETRELLIKSRRAME